MIDAVVRRWTHFSKAKGRITYPAFFLQGLVFDTSDMTFHALVISIEITRHASFFEGACPTPVSACVTIFLESTFGVAARRLSINATYGIRLLERPFFTVPVCFGEVGIHRQYRVETLCHLITLSIIQLSESIS
jgi:spore maturation protein SpmB